MTSRRLTLGQYLQKVQGCKILKKVKSCSKLPTQSQKTLSEEVQTKKRNVQNMMSVLRSKVLKMKVSDKDLQQIERLMENTTEQIKSDFDHLSLIASNSAESVENLGCKDHTLNSGKQLQSLATTENAQEFEGEVLGELSPNKKALRQESPRKLSFQFEDKNFLSVVNPMIGSQVRHRKYSSKQNSEIHEEQNPHQATFESSGWIRESKAGETRSQKNSRKLLQKNVTGKEVLNTAFKYQN